MSEVDYAGVCRKFTAKLGENLVRRVERSLGKDYEDLLKSEPKALLERIIRQVYEQYVIPFQMTFEIDSFLVEKHKIDSWKLFLGYPEGVLSVKEHMKEIREFLDSFYYMAGALDMMPKGEIRESRWWK